MKKNILPLFVIFVFGFANAQIKNQISYGIKGGLNIATWVGDVGDVNSKVGFHFGVFSEIKLSNKFSLQPELLYSSQGVKLKEVVLNIKGINYSADGNINLSYLNIPITMKYYVAKNISLDAGSQVGFLTNGKAEGTLNGDRVAEDVKKNFKSFDFSLVFGAGYVFSKNISTGIRYNLGMINISNNPTGGNSKVRSSILSLSIGYKL